MSALSLPLKNAPQGGFSGLVYSSTSDKRTPNNAQGLIASGASLVDAVQYRLKKMKSAVITSARLIQNQDNRGFRYRPAFITLTYNTSDYQWNRRDISGFITHCRNYARRHWPLHKFQYTWVAELQDRGAVHYHVIIWLPHLSGKKKACRLPKPDQQGWWYKGMSEIKWARNAVGYIAKYASKGGHDASGNTFPKGTRLYGNGGLTDQSRKEYRFWRLPSYLRDAINPKMKHSPDSFDMRPMIGGFYCRHSGVFVASDYTCVLIHGKRHIVKKANLYV